MAFQPFAPDDSTQQEGGSTFLDRMLDRVRRSFDSLKRAVTNDALVTATIGTADTKVYHGLGQQITSWDVVRKFGPGDIYESAAVNPSPNLYIILVSSVSVKATIRFA